MTRGEVLSSVSTELSFRGKGLLFVSLWRILSVVELPMAAEVWKSDKYGLSISFHGSSLLTLNSCSVGIQVL